MTVTTNFRQKNFTYLMFLAVLLCFAAPKAEAKMTATEVLDKVVQKLQNSPSLTMSVAIQSSNGNTNASLVMSREKFKYRVPGMDVYYDGTTQWTVDLETEEVSLTNPTADEVAESNPLAFVQNYQKNYTVSLISSDASTYTVRMTANSKRLYVRSADIVINASTWLPASVSATMSTGQAMTIRILSASQGTTLPVPTFRFDSKTYPGFEIIDLR